MIEPFDVQTELFVELQAVAQCLRRLPDMSFEFGNFWIFALQLRKILAPFFRLGIKWREVPSVGKRDVRAGGDLFRRASRQIALNLIPGVVETGLFVRRTDLLIVGTPNGVESHPAART